MKLRVLLGGQLAAGEDHDRDIGQRFVVSEFVENLESRHIRQTQIKYDAIRWLVAQCSKRRSTGRGCDDLDVVMAQKLGDTELLGLVVLDHQESLAPWFRVIADSSECRLNAFGGRRFRHKGE